MSPTIISGIILSVLSLIQTILPQLGVAGASATIVDGIITALTKIIPVFEQIAPLIGSEVSLIYQGIKNIVSNLRGTRVETTAQQDADLDALDAQVDNAWNAIAPQFDPDAASSAPPAANTPSTGP